MIHHGLINFRNSLLFDYSISSVILANVRLGYTQGLGLWSFSLFQKALQKASWGDPEGFTFIYFQI